MSGDEYCDLVRSVNRALVASVAELMLMGGDGKKDGVFRHENDISKKVFRLLW